jgi:hypothetical protein
VNARQALLWNSAVVHMPSPPCRSHNSHSGAVIVTRLGKVAPNCSTARLKRDEPESGGRVNRLASLRADTQKASLGALCITVLQSPGERRKVAVSKGIRTLFRHLRCNSCYTGTPGPEGSASERARVAEDP